MDGMNMVSKKLAEKICNAISEQRYWPVHEIELVDKKTFKCIFRLDDGVADVSDMAGSGMWDVLSRDVDDYEITEIDGDIEITIRYIKGEDY
jgi:hypothetical protein